MCECVFYERDKGHDSEQVSAVLVGIVRCVHPAGRRDGVEEGGRGKRKGGKNTTEGDGSAEQHSFFTDPSSVRV